MESWMDVARITIVGPPPSSFPYLFFNVHNWICMLPAVGVILGELIKAHALPSPTLGLPTFTLPEET